MKKIALALAFFALSFNGSAAFAGSSAPTAKQVRALEGKALFDILKTNGFGKLVEGSLSESLRIASGVGENSRIVDNRFVLAWGCVAHACSNESVLAIFDIENPGAVKIVWSQSESEDGGGPWASVQLKNARWMDSFGGPTRNDDDARRFPELAKAVADFKAHR